MERKHKYRVGQVLPYKCKLHRGELETDRYFKELNKLSKITIIELIDKSKHDDEGFVYRIKENNHLIFEDEILNLNCIQEVIMNGKG